MPHPRASESEARMWAMKSRYPVSHAPWSEKKGEGDPKGERGKEPSFPLSPFD